MRQQRSVSHFSIIEMHCKNVLIQLLIYLKCRELSSIEKTDILKVILKLYLICKMFLNLSLPFFASYNQLVLFPAFDVKIILFKLTNILCFNVNQKYIFFYV